MFHVLNFMFALFFAFIGYLIASAADAPHPWPYLIAGIVFFAYYGIVFVCIDGDMF